MRGSLCTSSLPVEPGGLQLETTFYYDADLSGASGARAVDRGTRVMDVLLTGFGEIEKALTF